MYVMKDEIMYVNVRPGPGRFFPHRGLPVDRPNGGPRRVLAETIALLARTDRGDRTNTDVGPNTSHDS